MALILAVIRSVRSFMRFVRGFEYYQARNEMISFTERHD
jgi:hypothetical protein